MTFSTDFLGRGLTAGRSRRGRRRCEGGGQILRFVDDESFGRLVRGGEGREGGGGQRRSKGEDQDGPVRRAVDVEQLDGGRVHHDAGFLAQFADGCRLP